MGVEAQYSGGTWLTLHSQVSGKAGFKTQIHPNMGAIREQCKTGHRTSACPEFESTENAGNDVWAKTGIGLQHSSLNLALQTFGAD